MNHSAQQVDRPPAGSPLPAALEVAAGLAATVAGAHAIAAATDLAVTFVLHAAFAFVVIGLVVVDARRRLRLGGGLGAANRVTLARGALVALLAAFVPAADLGASLAWPFALAVAALLLDGVDGAVARRTGTSSAFGARFDMELDAALGLILALLVLAHDRADAWVLLLGIPRYAFLAAARAWPALRRPLTPSRRRRVICVVQIATLAGALAPFVPSWLTAPACAAAAVALYASFAADVRALATADGRPAHRKPAHHGPAPRGDRP